MSVKAKVWIGCGVIVVAIAAYLLWPRGSEATSATASAPLTKEGGSPSDRAAARPDPRKLEHAKISGTITDEATHQPIAHARVCADGYARGLPSSTLRDPLCVQTDDQGRYAIPDVLAARYSVVAMAKGYRPESHYVDDQRKQTDFDVAAGAQVANIDIALRPGGATVHGTITDVTGGTIPRAQVRAASGRWGRGAWGPMVESDDKGHYELWVRAGEISVLAVADGYAGAVQSGEAPGKIDVVLTPESSLAGTVVDATSGAPVAGVKVGLDSDDETDVTDDKGHFNIQRINPGRYIAIARAPKGYGKSAGSTLVGLGQHVDGVTIKLWPAQQVVARVVVGADKQPCKFPDASLEDTERHTWVGFEREADGTLTADGVLPGSYKPHPFCQGFAAGTEYPKAAIDGKQGVLEWRVDPGATVTGKITTKTGAPVDDGELTLRLTGGAREDMQWFQARTDKDGVYRSEGLRPGKFHLEVGTTLAVGPREGYEVEVAAGATVTKDIVMEDGGTIRGTVTDASGAAVPDVEVRASSNREGDWWGKTAKTDDKGVYHLDEIRPGDYRVTASHGWFDELRKPGTNDDAKQGEKTVVRAAQTSNVNLLVEIQSGSITGSVLDTGGKPVSDAFVVSTRESDAAGAAQSQVQNTRWFGEDHPVVSGVDGTFTLAKLSPGKYTVRAYRKGGGEAVAEHVAVGTKAELRIKPTGSIAGTVTPAPPDNLSVTITDPKTAFSRDESFFKTNGVYAVKDLPAGHYIVTVTGNSGHATTELDLADDQQKTGVDFTLAANATITGRFVEAGTGNPVPGMMAFASASRGGGFTMSFDSDQRNVSDADGRFTIKDVAKGQMTIRGWPKDWQTSPYASNEVIKQITGDMDLGNIPLTKKRVKPGDPVGELGLKFVQLPMDTPPEQYQWKVSYIDPQGPAVKSGIVVGDVVVSVDGTDCTGANATAGWNQIQAPPGTTLKLGLASGKLVAITLAAP